MFIDTELVKHFKYLGFENLLPHVVCLAENRSVETIIDFVSNTIQQNKLPILQLSVNPIYFESYLIELTKHFDPTKFFILSSDCKNQTHLNVAPWPSALLMQHIGQHDYSSTGNKNFRISYLMRNTRLHRLELLDSIKSYVTDQDVVVANSVIENNIPLNVRNSSKAMEWLKTLPWSNNQDYIDLHSHNRYGSNLYTNVDHPAFRARVNITGESWAEDDLVFITEKTWKAYASGCLVVNYGSKYVPDTLETLGFAIWKDFDLCLSYKDKITKITELFQRDDIDDLYEKNQELIKHNQQLVLSQSLVKNLTSSAIEKIQNLL